MSDSVPHATKKPRWALRALGTIILLLLSALTVHAWWSSRAAVAFRAQVATYARAGQPTRGEDLEQPAVSDADNAVIDLRTAAAAISASTQPYKPFSDVGFTLPWSKKERAAVDATIAHHAPELDRVAVAATKTANDWKIRLRSPTISTLLPDLSSQRALANLLAGAAIHAHLRGDDAQALEHVHELLFQSRAIDQMAPTLVRHLVAVGIRALACAAIEQITPDLRANDPAVWQKAMKLIAELQSDEPSLQRGLHGALLAERVFIIDTAQCLANGKLTLAGISGTAGARGASVMSAVSSSPGGGYLARPLIFNDARLCLDRATQCLAAGDAPTWPAAKALIDAATAQWNELAQKGDIHDFAQLLGASYDRAILTQYRAITDGRLAATALALRLYAVDHYGERPPTLAQLVPTYLTAPLVDPFASDGAALKYLQRAIDPILYSLDENMIDDGGSENPKTSGLSPKQGRWASLDAVMHLTRQPRDPATITEDLRD